MPGVFVTGTDTGVGKTQVAAGLIRALVLRKYSTLGIKPVASGCRQTPAGLRNDDALSLMAASNVVLPYEQVNPFAYEAPVAPHLAAGGAVPPEGVVSSCQAVASQAEWVIVEGVGGWMVPLDSVRTMADVAVALGYPVILVIALRLGCLNHALLSAAAIQQSGLRLVGWVGVCLEPGVPDVEEMVSSLSGRIESPSLGVIPYLRSPDVDQVAKRIDLTPLLAI
ncbi:MAG: dethiobiotin synthase [Gammaproteobacteria bacterium]|nr:dethiobiotin synthase [Gammaproteobacteria bacterium]